MLSACFVDGATPLDILGVMFEVHQIVEAVSQRGVVGADSFVVIVELGYPFQSVV